MSLEGDRIMEFQRQQRWKEKHRIAETNRGRPIRHVPLQVAWATWLASKIMPGTSR